MASDRVCNAYMRHIYTHLNGYSQYHTKNIVLNIKLFLRSIEIRGEIVRASVNSNSELILSIEGKGIRFRLVLSTKEKGGVWNSGCGTVDCEGKPP